MFLNEMLGADRSEAPPEASYRIVVGERAVNPIEQELKERCSMEVARIAPQFPPIFLDSETGELEKPTNGKPEPWAQYFDGRVPAPWECARLMMDFTALIEADPRVIAARRRIQIARDLGPIRNIQVTRDGRATCPEYEAACKKEDITP